MRWTAIALVTPDWHARPVDSQPHQVTPSVRFSPLPDWFFGSLENQTTREELGEHVHNTNAFCLQTDYEAPPSAPSVAGISNDDSLISHDQARSDIQLAVTMLWLTKRSSFGFDKTILAEELQDGWTWREIASHDERIALTSYSNTDLDPIDFRKTLCLSEGLKNSKDSGTVRTALNALSLALSQRSWPLRYLAIWLALEGLFGPTDASETTFRLCQRISLFVAGRGRPAVDMFAKVKEAYRWRSKTVHGMRLQKLGTATSEVLLEEAESLLQVALVKILSTQDLVATFDNVGRDKYLDNLALT